MRIAIDASSVPAQPAGAGVYAIELVRALAERDARDGYALFARGDWPASIDGLAGRRNWRIERVPGRSRPARLAWEQAALPRALRPLGIDVLHSTHHTLPLVPMRPVRVVTIHDITFFRLPERYPPARRLYMQTLTRLAARAADRIVVPSQTVRGDVTERLRVPASKVAVVYEAPASRFRPVEPAEALAVAKRYGIDGRYVLSVGSMEPGKNRARLFEAMRRLRDAGIDVRLVVAGNPAWGAERERDATARLGLERDVVFAGYVPDADLAALYAAAAGFAFPSLYEGFGLPVLEAMACGSPVLTSRISATAEVAGDAALLVDPYSVDAIAEGLRAILCDDALRQRLVASGHERATQFSWRRAADETHAVYEAALSERRAS